MRGRKAVLKLQHKLKAKLRARSKNKKLAAMEEHLEKKGIKANLETLRNRTKKRRTLMELEGNLAKRDAAIDDSDVDADNGMDVENIRVGRKRQRSISSDDDYDSDASMEDAGKGRAKSATLKRKSQSRVRSMTAGRREGTVPKRNPIKMETEEGIRLAKKINKRFKHCMNVNESDRKIAVKKPKHLYVGKMSNGTRNRR